jgi:peroxiredoxin
MSDVAAASSPLPIGAIAPDFILRRTFEENVSLSDLLSRGPVVVAFYVFDFGNI